MSDNFRDSLPDDLRELEGLLEDFKPEALDRVAKGRLSAAIIHARPEEDEPADLHPATETKQVYGLRHRVIAFAGGLALAASIAVVFGLGRNKPQVEEALLSLSAETASRDASLAPARIPEDAKAISSQSELKDIVYEGIILTEASTRMRQVRTLYTDTVSWIDPATEARLELSFDREELFLIPVDAI